MRIRLIGAFVIACALGSATRAQVPTILTAPPPTLAPQTATTATAPTPCCLLAAGDPVEIELTETLSSKTAQPDQMFGIKLVRDVVVDGHVVIPTGAVGLGEVIDVGHAGFSGRPGKLILAARYLKVGGQRVPLRSFRLSGAGHDDSKTIGLLSASVPIFILATGGEIEFPDGTRAFAKIGADTVLPSTEPAAVQSSSPTSAPFTAKDHKP